MATASLCFIVLLYRGLPQSLRTTAEVSGYPGHLGVKRALRDIVAAAAAYRDVHGALPDDLRRVEPHLQMKYSASDRVTARALLPSAILIPLDPSATQPATGGASFVVIAYLRKGGPMPFDCAVGEVDSIRPNAYAGTYFDDDLVGTFGPEPLERLKRVAFQLP